MPRRPPVALALLLTAACSSSSSGTHPQGVPVAPVDDLQTSALVACARLKAALPEQLTNGVSRRLTAPVSDTTTAYGDPAIAVRCGVPAGSARDDPFTFNDVAWAMHDTGATRTWTTVGRSVNVQVVVPDAYSSQAELVGTVSFAVVTALR